jgi:hypothetical protein
MANPTFGGDEWISSIIKSFRIDLSEESNDQFEIDYVAVGRFGISDIGSGSTVNLLANSFANTFAAANTDVDDTVASEVISGLGLEPGDIISASLQILAFGARGGALRLQFRDAGLQVIGDQFLSSRVRNSSSWQTVRVEGIAIPVGTARINLILDRQDNADGEVGARRPSLNIGISAADGSPVRNDVEPGATRTTRTGDIVDDSIQPLGIDVGVSGTVSLIKNSNHQDTEGSQPGEIRFKPGVIYRPNGTEYKVSSAFTLNTPYEASRTGVAFLILGKDTVHSRFGNSFGQNVRVFVAFFDDGWFAIDNTEQVKSFTPDSDDVIIAKLNRFSATSPGIETLDVYIGHSNLTTRTSDLDDDAGLGQTADWDNVTGDNRPDDGATRNTGDLADMDRVGTNEIENGATSDRPNAIRSRNQYSINNGTQITPSLSVQQRVEGQLITCKARIKLLSTGSRDIRLEIRRGSSTIVAALPITITSNFYTYCLNFWERGSSSTQSYHMRVSTVGGAGANIEVSSSEIAALVLKR